jgi:hypothetical protein
MSSAEVEPLDGARTTNHDEPAIESNGCSSKAEQSLSNGHVTTFDDVTTTKTIQGKVLDGVGGGLDPAEKPASDLGAIPSEQDNVGDKEVLTCFLPSP